MITPPVPESEQQVILTYVKQTWDKGIKARAEWMPQWREAFRAYRAAKDVPKSPRVKQTKLMMPWAYTAIESWTAYQYANTWPNDQKVFSVVGRNRDDHPLGELCEKLLKYQADTGEWEGLWEQFLRLAGLAPLAVKVRWDDEARCVLPEHLPLKDFGFYPIKGKWCHATKIHQTYRFYEDLVGQHRQLGEASPYFNIEKITLEDEERDQDQAKAALENEKREGLCIKEAWIPRLKYQNPTDGQTVVLRDVIATTVNDKWLIRLQQNPFGQYKTPFIWFVLIPDADPEDPTQLGHGLLHRALDMHKAASMLRSMHVDGLKKLIYPQWIYNAKDGTFDPNRIINTPGGFHAADKPMELLAPLDADIVSKAQVSNQEIEALKIEFEEATIPRMVKGQLDEGVRTATEVAQTQQNASNVGGQQSKKISERLLKPILALALEILNSRMAVDEALRYELAKAVNEGTVMTEQGPVPVSDDELLASFPTTLPTDDVDIVVQGYQNVANKMETAQALQAVIPQMIEGPMADQLNWDELPKVVFEATGLDKDRLLLPPDQVQANRQARQEQEQQAAQVAAQQQQATIDAQSKIADAEVLKVQLQHEAKMAEIELKRLELELKYQQEQAKMMLDAAKPEPQPQGGPDAAA